MHIVEDDSNLDIEFMKHCSINSGKLCKFGVDLPKYYSSSLREAYVYGKIVAYEEALQAVSNAIKSWIKTRGTSEGVILCTGDATCEELLILRKVADSVDVICATGLGEIVEAMGSTALLRKSSNFNIIEYARSIVLVDIDPYYQYPLISRKLQIAKAHGAHIVSIGVEKSHIKNIADEVQLVHPSRIQEAVKSMCEIISPETLFITSLGIYSNPSVIATINNTCTKQHSRIMYMKDFANMEGALVIGFDTKSNTIDSIISGIESGKITALILVESPLYDSYIDNERFRKACEKLQSLIVLQSQFTSSVPDNAIVLPLPLFYERKGSLINVCGRFLSLGGDREGVVSICNDIFEKLGVKKHFKFETLTQEIRYQYNKWMASAPEYSIVDIPKASVVDGPCHKYVSNPFLVRGLPYNLSKRTGSKLYPVAKEKEYYVIKQEIADDVILAYEKDSRFKKAVERYD
ncbi:MAG: molybdopterin-dependent oxidoreductase [Candidatus Methanofastidiosia archaeon]